MKIDSLTRREREIVALVSDGLRNAAIAERLFISEATVRNHLTSILSKLALTDRFDLAVYAFRQGLDRPAELSPRRLYREEHPPPRHQSADRDWAGRDRTE
jgi:DNA-binding CsgD family transcriptional regulator